VLKQARAEVVLQGIEWRNDEIVYLGWKIYVIMVAGCTMVLSEERSETTTDLK
jgi:hypothetical protein